MIPMSKETKHYLTELCIGFNAQFGAMHMFEFFLLQKIAGVMTVMDILRGGPLNG